MTRGRRSLLDRGAALTWAACLAAGAFGLAGRAGAQDVGEEPVVIGQREKRPAFQLYPTTFYLTLVGQYASDTRETDTEDTETTELRFEESVAVKTGGYVVHPNLVEFKFDGSFGLAQSEFDFNGQTVPQDGTIYEFDFEANILRLEPTHYTVYARRDRQLIHQQFAPSLDSTTSTYGASVETAFREVQMRFDAFRLESEQSALDGSSDFTYLQDTLRWSGRFLPTANQRMTWDYSFESVEQSSELFGLDSATDTHELDLEHLWRFGNRGEHELDSNFDYFNQTGDFSIERVILTEQLRLRHTPKFWTEYLYRYQQQSRDGFDQDQHQAEARLQHRLYRSLTTNARAGAIQFATSEGSETQEFYADADVEYEKIVPLGLLRLDFGVNFAQLDSDTQGGGFQIIDAGASFNDPVPIIIFGQNIDPNSIVVTGPTGLIYLQGKDYLVNSAFPDRVELTRVPTGRIGNGQAILIDYQLGATGQSSSTTTGFDLGAHYSIDQGPLKGLAFFARYGVQQQQIDPEGSGIPVSDFTDILYGTEYRFWSLTLRAEQQIHDAEIVPFDATRFLARLAHRMRQTTISGDATYSIINYDEPENRVELITVSGAVDHQLTRELRASLSAVWRDQTDDLAGHTQGFEQLFELNWKHRQTEIFMLLRNSAFDSEDLNNDFQLFQIGIRREF